MTRQTSMDLSIVAEFGPHRILSSGSLAGVSMVLQPIQIGTAITFGETAQLQDDTEPSTLLGEKQIVGDGPSPP